MSNISDRLKTAMLHREMSAAELSKLSKVSESLISRYLKGDYSPKTDKVDLLARALNVNPVWLMGFDDKYSWDSYNPPLMSKEELFSDDPAESKPAYNVSDLADPVLAELISMYEQMTTLERSKLLIAAAEMLGDR